MTTVLLVLVVIVTLIGISEACARQYLKNNPPILHTDHQTEVSAELAEAYFRNQDSIQDLILDAVFYQLGVPRDCDDWDFGRLNYTWRSKNRCLRIYIRGDRIEAVHLMDPVNTPRFGPPIEVLWESQSRA